MLSRVHNNILLLCTLDAIGTFGSYKVSIIIYIVHSPT